jgi:hypothetical protein
VTMELSATRRAIYIRKSGEGSDFRSRLDISSWRSTLCAHAMRGRRVSLRRQAGQIQSEILGVLAGFPNSFK